MIEECFNRNPVSETQCLSQQQKEAWVAEHDISIRWFEVETKIYYSAQERSEYHLQRLAPIFIEQINLSKKVSLTSLLKVHQATFEDSIYNPFNYD